MKISVVIPVYNAEKSLKRCLDSVVNQTYDNWEVIAINDGSSDNSYKILQEYELKDQRFKILSQSNHGPGYARNVGIRETTGEYIVFLDSDDYIENLYFQELVECVKKNHSDIVFIDVIQENPNGKLIKHETMSKYKNKTKDTIIRHQMTGKLPWGGCRKAVRAELIKRNNITYSEDIVGEEALFSFKALSSANIISFIDKPYYHYINYPNSQSKKGDDNPWGHICKKMRIFLKENNLLQDYHKTINSFGFTSSIITINRISNNYDICKAIVLSKNEMEEFRNNYDYNLDYSSLEKRVLYMLPFAKLNMVWTIVLASKIKTLLKL